MPPEKSNQMVIYDLTRNYVVGFPSFDDFQNCPSFDGQSSHDTSSKILRLRSDKNRFVWNWNVQFKTINNGKYSLLISVFILLRFVANSCVIIFLHVVAQITILLQSSQIHCQLVLDNPFSSVFKVFHQYFSSWRTGPLYFCSVTWAPTYISDI